MKPDSHENKIKQHFAESRLHDERRAPTFARTWQSAASRAHGVHTMPTLWRLAAIGAALVAVGVAAMLFLQHSITPPLQHSVSSPPVVLITQWQSPTQFLLNPSSTTDNTTSALEQN